MISDLRKVVSHAAVVFVLCLFAVEPSASAQSNCKEVEATFVDVCSGGPSCSGTITNGGILNGTTMTVFTGGPLPTPGPTTSSFSADITVTTNQGQLKTSNVIVFDVDGFVAASVGHINPATSTGRFAGATGVLFTSGKTIGFSPFTIKLKFTGEICLVNE